jgi:DNA polymerase-3 subunit epsilon
LKAQLDHYADMENDMSALSKESSFTNNVDFAGRMVYDENGREVFNFGKYKGMPVDAVLDRDPGYYGWMMNGDFTLNTKQVLTRIKLRGIKR